MQLLSMPQKNPDRMIPSAPSEMPRVLSPFQPRMMLPGKMRMRARPVILSAGSWKTRNASRTVATISKLRRSAAVATGVTVRAKHWVKGAQKPPTITVPARRYRSLPVGMGPASRGIRIPDYPPAQDTGPRPQRKEGDEEQGGHPVDQDLQKRCCRPEEQGSSGDREERFWQPGNREENHGIGYFWHGARAWSTGFLIYGMIQVFEPSRAA